jgi:hypothetical protein
VAAATQWCNGLISNMLIQFDGILMVIPEFRQDWIALCSVTAQYGSISPDTCRSWQSSITTAIAMKLTTTILFVDAPACNVVPTYGNAPAVGYVRIVN